MNTLIALGVLGLIVNRGTDFLRTAFDKGDRIPKSWWLLISWGLGIVLAAIVCNVDGVATLAKLPLGSGCVAFVLTGIGLGSVAGFWHELLSALSARSGPALTPKGLVPRSSV